jgi:oxysterol-binding protein-related protein 9/10/11
LLRGALTVTVADTCYVTCPKTGLKTILHYLEEGWLGKAQNKVIGVIYKYNPDKDNITRIKDVPDKDIVGKIDGCWKDKVYYTPAGKDKSVSIIVCYFQKANNL